MTYESQKHGGEDAIARTALECAQEEADRLGEFTPPKIDFRHLHLIKSVVGNPFYNHDPDNEPNTDALVA